MASCTATQSSIPQYVSPILGPTNLWAQENFPGTFRPPNPQFLFNSSFESGRTVEGEHTTHRFSFQSAGCHYLKNKFQSNVKDIPQGLECSADRIMSLLLTAVVQEKDVFAIQKESNHILERELKQVRKHREETQQALHKAELILMSLEAIHKKQTQLLRELQFQKKQKQKKKR